MVEREEHEAVENKCKHIPDAQTLEACFWAVEKTPT